MAGMGVTPAVIDTLRPVPDGAVPAVGCSAEPEPGGFSGRTETGPPPDWLGVVVPARLGGAGTPSGRGGRGPGCVGRGSLGEVGAGGSSAGGKGGSVGCSIAGAAGLMIRGCAGAPVGGGVSGAAGATFSGEPAGGVGRPGTTAGTIGAFWPGAADELGSGGAGASRHGTNGG